MIYRGDRTHTVRNLGLTKETATEFVSAENRWLIADQWYISVPLILMGPLIAQPEKRLSAVDFYSRFDAVVGETQIRHDGANGPEQCREGGSVRQGIERVGLLQSAMNGAA